MQGSKQLIKANVVMLNNRLCVDIPHKDMPKRARNSNPPIINKVDDLLVEGDTVEGYVFESNYYDKLFSFYVTKNVSRSLNKDEFISLVNKIVVERINNELSLFDKPKRHINYDNFLDKIRWREYVIGRYIAVSMVIEFLNNQVNDEYMAEKYHMDRCTVIHAKKELDKYGFNSQLNNIVNDVRRQIADLYESLKQPQDIEIFEFLPQ